MNEGQSAEIEPPTPTLPDCTCGPSAPCSSHEWDCPRHEQNLPDERIAAVEAVLSRWDGVIAECQQADPRWILDQSVTTFMSARDELRRALGRPFSPGASNPEPTP